MFSAKQPQQGEGLRAAFKDSLTKLIQINTRQQATRQLKSLILQNKTTINLRVWLSVLAQNRKRHSQSEIGIIGFIIQQYGKGLLDPLDKVPSLEKTVFRISELLIKLYFSEEMQNVSLALQRTWNEFYLTTLKDEEPQLKKKLLYNNLEAILNGGADRVSQVSAQIVLEGLLENSLNLQDFAFFKEIAKRTLVLFLKTTVIHPSVQACLQTVLGYFNVNNLTPLLENIISKVLSYLPLAPTNSIGYKMKSEVCNTLALIGEQVDQNGVVLLPKVMKPLENLATDKVWAVQVTGRKALAVWKKKKKEWEQDYSAKQQEFFPYPTAQNFHQGPQESPKIAQERPRPRTAENFYQKPQQEGRDEVVEMKELPQYKFPDYSQGGYLHKMTGVGGGNTVQSVEQYYERHKPQQTYSRKMEEIKKSIYKPKEQYTQYDETVPWQEGKQLPTPKQPQSQPPTAEEEGQFMQDRRYLQAWEGIVEQCELGRKEEAAKAILQLDDDIYFLRFVLKYGKGLLKDLTKSTSSKVLKRMLAIKKTNFMEQLFFKMVAESAKSGVSALLTNQQNLQISEQLQAARKLPGLQKVANKLKKTYEKSLIDN